MCLITGFINFENSKEKAIEVLKNLNYRGHDASGIYIENKIIIEKTPELLENKTRTQNSSKIILAHNLHAIVNQIPQPIKKQVTIIANCEIYNWEELKEKYNLNSKNDTELILDLIELNQTKDIKEIINEFEGPFALAYLNKEQTIITLARDIIGEKPLYYHHNKKNKTFCFASEKKAIEKYKNLEELNPRQIITYNIKTNTLKITQNNLEYPKQELKDSYLRIKQQTKHLLEKAILKQIPKNQKIGLLFSGGIDSTFIAYILKKNNINFTAYTAALEGGNIWEAEDLKYAIEIAKKYDFPLKIAKTPITDLEKHTKKVIKLIEDKDYVKVSVALPFYLSAKQAKKDNVKVMFSGLGSEEIFAGYRRHKKVEDPNLECYNGLLSLHQRDLYRDDIVCMANSIELRLPFLDKNLINHSLKIPVKYKLNLEQNRSKIILRDISKEMGLEEKYAERQKKAAQYGSKFDKGLLSLAKQKGLAKQEYIDNL